MVKVMNGFRRWESGGHALWGESGEVTWRWDRGSGIELSFSVCSSHLSLSWVLFGFNFIWIF